MIKIRDLFRKGTVIPLILVLGALISIFAIAGLRANTLDALSKTDMYTSPATGTLVVGQTFTISVVVNSSIPVNAFSGDISFDPSALEIHGLSYNTSIIDLWVKEPWYSKGAGTIHFAGGTTKPGGFTGTGTIMTATFLALKTGAGYIGIHNAQILKSDGLGSTVPLDQPIDSIFTVTNPASTTVVLQKQSSESTHYVVASQKPTTDLNGDNQTNIADVSIFMIDMAQQNKVADFNQDGVVNLADLSILMGAL